MKITIQYLPVLCLLIFGLPGVQSAVAHPPVDGVLRVSAKNPRYFTDNSGRAVYLTGSHTWSNFCEIWQGGPTPFDYPDYLDWLDSHNHNFFRLWTWEHASWGSWSADSDKVRFGPPLAYPRTGPGLALDNLPRFDVSRFNPVFFQRLRERVEMAQKRGIYCQVMLFQGWSIQHKSEQPIKPGEGNPWKGHPFNRANNINGVDGDPDGDGQGQEVHSLWAPRINELQKAYIRKVVDTLGDLDNFIYEISNESDTTGVEWHYAMINYIHEYERTRPKRHPVVMTVPWPFGDNRTLFASPAEAVAPNPEGDKGLYRKVFPPADGRKVVFTDTDHLWGIGGDADWAWKAFLSGYNPMFMDPLVSLTKLTTPGNYPDAPAWDPLRINLGYTLRFAERMDLISMTPQPKLASSGFCLASDRECLVYMPEGGTVTADLSALPGGLTAEWFSPKAGDITDVWRVEGGKKVSLTAPFEGNAVLYVHR